MRYEEYLRSSQWRRKRDVVRSRSGGMCELCGQRQATQVHHIRYPKRLGEEPLSDLIDTCRQCHERNHGMIETPRDRLTLSFQGRDLSVVAENDSELLWLWEDVERAVLPDVAQRHAPQGRPALKANMREGRHYESRNGVDYLTHAGIVRWAQIVPREHAPDDNVLWLFSDWVEDMVKAVRNGDVAIFSTQQAAPVPATQAHPHLLEAMSTLETRTRAMVEHMAQETGRLDHAYETLPALQDGNAWITAREGCIELGVDPDRVVRGRENLETAAGRELTKANRPRGPKREQRLSGSGHMTQVNTYSRADVHYVVKEIIRRSSH